ncbi:MAG: PEP-CTERM sorting domain-containing protein [Crocosphaera sp.]
MNLLIKTPPLVIASGTAVAVAFIFTANPEATQAAIINTFSDQTAFLDAAGESLIMDDFEDIPAFSVFPTLARTGVTYSSSFTPDPNALGVFPDGFGGVPAITTNTLFAQFFGQTLIADYSTDVDAFGAEITSFNNASPVDVSISFVGGGTPTVITLAATPNPQFFGFTSDMDVASITFIPQSGFTVGIDDLAYGQATQASVPEPNAVLGLGLLGLGVFFKSKLKQNKDSHKA